ncbi:MAG: lysophospholipid acyltransferase family protein, partial [Thermoanaerobaculia bacterium]
MDSWQYEPTADFDKSPIEKLRTFPRQPDMLVYALRLVLHTVLRVWLRIYHRYRVLGREHLPLERPFAMIANHGSHLDAISLLSALPLLRIQRAYPAAAKDYFFTSMPKIAFSAVAMNAMPFDRKENPRESLALCRELLETPGHVLIIFPEGTRTPTGEMQAFKPGIGFLTAGTNIPVVP